MKNQVIQLFEKGKQFRIPVCENGQRFMKSVVVQSLSYKGRCVNYIDSEGNEGRTWLPTNTIGILKQSTINFE